MLLLALLSTSLSTTTDQLAGSYADCRDSTGTS